jgi:hypothetical protein
LTLDVLNVHGKFETLWDQSAGGIVHDMGEALFIEQVSTIDYIVG